MIEDVADRIVDFLWNDKRTLKTCSLVSSSWNTAATYHLFDSLVVDPCLLIAPKDQPSNMHLAYHELKNCPRIVKTVKFLRLDSLWIHMSPPRHVPDFSATHEIDHIGFLCVDILGDVLALFTNLRNLVIDQFVGAMPAARDVVPHMDFALARPTPVNLDGFGIQIAINNTAWILTYRALFKFFGAIGVLYLHDPGPFDFDVPERMVIPTTSLDESEVSHSVSKLMLSFEDVFSRVDTAAYVEKYLHLYINLSCLTTLTVDFKTRFPRALNRLAAVLVQTVTISSLVINFTNHTLDDWAAEIQRTDIFDGATRSLAGLNALREFTIQVPLHRYELETMSDVGRTTAVSTNNAIFAACMGLVGAPPHLSRACVALPNWHRYVTSALSSFEALDCRPLDGVMARQQSLTTLKFVHPFYKCDDLDIRARAEKVVYDAVSAGVAPLLKMLYSSEDAIVLL